MPAAPAATRLPTPADAVLITNVRSAPEGARRPARHQRHDHRTALGRIGCALSRQPGRHVDVRIRALPQQRRSVSVCPSRSTRLPVAEGSESGEVLTNDTDRTREHAGQPDFEQMSDRCCLQRRMTTTVGHLPERCNSTQFDAADLVLRTHSRRQLDSALLRPARPVVGARGADRQVETGWTDLSR